MDNQEEIFPIVDEEGRVIGSATRGECHSGSHLLHPVVHLHVFNSQGNIYLQRRPEWKDIQPGKWDTAVGGHIDYGETPDDALRREVREELGITEFTPQFICKYVLRDSRRHRQEPPHSQLRKRVPEVFRQGTDRQIGFSSPTD